MYVQSAASSTKKKQKASGRNAAVTTGRLLVCFSF